jgi:hypothetical protein
MASPDFCGVRLYYHDEPREARSTRLLLAVDPGVRVDFGDGGGLDAFKRRMNTPAQNF